MDAKIKELASDNVLTSAYLILAECERLHSQISLELLATRDDRKEQIRQYKEVMSELWATLRKIQSQFKIDASLLGLIEPNKGKKDRNRDNEKTKIHARRYNRRG